MSFKLELRELEQLTQQLSTTNLRFSSCDKDILGGWKGRKGGRSVVQWEVAGRLADAQPPASGYGLP